MSSSEAAPALPPSPDPESIIDSVDILRVTPAQRVAMNWPHIEGPSRDAGDAESQRASLATWIENILHHGNGAVIVRGVCDGDEAPGIRAALARLAGLLGTLAPQDSAGNRIVAVEAAASSREARGYQRQIALRPHTDFHEFMGLACVRSAASGGETLLASGAAILAALRVERPDLAAALMAGFPQAFAGEPGVTAGAAPVFVDGLHVAIFAHRLFYKEAARQLGVALPAALVEGMEMIAAIAERPGIAVRFALTPGDILLWNNFRLVHGRTAFEAEDARLLLRAWINPWRGSAPHPSFVERVRQLDTLHARGRSPIAYNP